MKGRITGITVTLYLKKQVGTDAAKHPVYTEEAIDVEDVLVGSPSSDDIITSTQMYGKKLVFNLHIPKGDTHDWTDAKVAFFGRTFKTFGLPLEYIEENVPLRWNKTVMVEVYE